MASASKSKRSGRKANKLDSRSSSLSLGARLDSRTGKLKTERVRNDDAEFDLNISFSGGYVPNTDLIRVDKGQGNP